MDPGRGRWPTLTVLKDEESFPEWLDDVNAHVRAICPIWGWLMEGHEPTDDEYAAVYPHVEIFTDFCDGFYEFGATIPYERRPTDPDYGRPTWHGFALDKASARRAIGIEAALEKLGIDLTKAKKKDTERRARARGAAAPRDALHGGDGGSADGNSDSGDSATDMAEWAVGRRVRRPARALGPPGNGAGARRVGGSVPL